MKFTIKRYDGYAYTIEMPIDGNALVALTDELFAANPSVFQITVPCEPSPAWPHNEISFFRPAKDQKELTGKVRKILAEWKDGQR